MTPNEMPPLVSVETKELTTLSKAYFEIIHVSKTVMRMRDGAILDRRAGFEEVWDLSGCNEPFTGTPEQLSDLMDSTPAWQRRWVCLDGCLYRANQRFTDKAGRECAICEKVYQTHEREPDAPRNP